ncbi:hypothetical protein N7495_004161 [Penicillium taxi]|uniref:uncharacterized protein n=1 Tax=Penicillium taxi TaxID=168475 RepID=UPI0025456852|nr:uncharacterized protein N7495_004161 [Penicillium taxi]KAJ5899417.1 hypothetical protein N7495_004161 [Penicillium taxi]
MSSRQQIDSVIDDDDEFCPLCIEEFDLSDKNFKPCPCGYQICQFCYNNIKTHSEEGRCPNCRRPYDESTIQYKIPDVEEFKADLALKHRKAAAAKKKEAEKREIEASSRKNLAGVRVVQKNLVYIIGLNPAIRDENQLLQTLRGKEYFGQYGEIEKIVVSKAKPGSNQHQGIGVYVTFSRKADAALCISAVDGSHNGDRMLRAQYGTTKYCSSFLRNEQCNNRNCTFLHETGEDSESYSRSDLSSMNTLSSQRQHQQPSIASPASHPRSTHPPISQPMRRQPSKDDSISGRQPPDGPALPSSASWANSHTTIRTRRTSLTGSQASQSPRPVNVTVATFIEEPKRPEKQSIVTPESQIQPDTRSPKLQHRRSSEPKLAVEHPSPFDNLIKEITSPDFRFVFSPSELPAEEMKIIQNYPSFIDPYGGVKRRAMREKAEQERVKREQVLLQSVAAEEESREAGSLQLGGEPEESNTSRGRQSRESHGAIQPPSHQGTTDNSTVGSPVSATSLQFQGLNLAGRSLTPLQQQQLMLLKSAGNQQSGLSDPISSVSSSDQAAQVRQNLLQTQQMAAQVTALQAQSRQPSRFSFTSEVATKNISNARMLSQMQAATPNPLSAPSPQYSSAGGFYASGVQGPPPGLKTAGTPPVSGGGMFAQGHGFTSNNLGLGSTMGKQDATPEMMRELMRGRSGTNVGGVQSQEAAKREFMFPFLQQHQTPPPLTPVNGLLGSFYGPQAGTAPDSGSAQKQKKKGKKHRHANTSSGGGGVVDLADPSILQARMHQAGSNATAGQALYGSQGGYNPSMMYGSVNEDFPPLGSGVKESQSVIDTFGFLKSQLPNDSTGRVGTPTLPPGLPLPHAHPSSAFHDSKPSSPAPIMPPGLGSVLSRANTPSKDSRSTSPDITRLSNNSSRKDASQISLGSPVARIKHETSMYFAAPDSPALKSGRASPVAKSTHKTRMAKLDLSAGTEKELSSKVENPLHWAAPQEIPAFKPDRASPVAKSSSKTRMTKLDLSVGAEKESSSKVENPPSMNWANQEMPSFKSDRAISGTVTSGTGSVSAISSRPHTPMTSASRVSDSPAPHQARILRVVATPKAEVSRAPSVTPSVAGTGVSASRRQSVSSIGRSDRGYGSDADFYPSTTASRANSPPAPRIGSAPVRAITKSQLKKDRRQKAKEAEAKGVVTLPEEPVQAPIMGRKRKAKKASNTADLAESPLTETEQLEEIKPAPVEKTSSEVEIVTEAWHTHNTIDQLCHDAEEDSRPITDLVAERMRPTQEIIADMHKSGSVDLKMIAMFAPANVNQRTDMKCTIDDYDVPSQPTRLTEDHRKALLRGEPVRIGSELKYRCLITPRGCVIRHLYVEEEQQYLDIEKNRGNILDVSYIGDSSANLNGGLEALFATPEKFNICWVDDTTTRLGSISPNETLDITGQVIPPNVLSAMEADSTRSHDWAVAHSAELLQTTTAAVRSFAAATAKQILGSSVLTGSEVTLEDVASMSDTEIKNFSSTSIKDLEGTRKELDSVDKKLSALLRRNRKLQQQALGIAGELE